MTRQLSFQMKKIDERERALILCCPLNMSRISLLFISCRLGSGTFFLKRSRIFIEGAQLIKRDGSKSSYPIHASKVRIEDLVLEDKKRKAMFEVKK